MKYFFLFCAVMILPFHTQVNSQSEPKPKFEPNWESLKKYTTPEWNMDAKFGIFIHWGAYSVPAEGSEWYPRRMYHKNDTIFAYHKETWGDQSDFGYKDFIPMMKAEKWNPDEWAELFEKSGAKYVVPVAEHHDGFALYNSSHTRWDSTEMGPMRDICGELAEAVRKRGMKFGVSSHYAWNWRYYTYDDSFDTVDPNYSDLYGKRHEPDEPASKEFIEHWSNRTTELIDKYQPDLLWFDFGFAHSEFEEARKKIAAYYYNKGIEWDKGVVLNYKRWTKPEVGVTEPAFPPGAGTLDLEREKSPRIREFFWQTDTSVSSKSWGYIQNDAFKSPNTLVDDLVDIVSKNGCLLLNIGPRPDGTIPQEAQDILLAIGKWLDVNGEAIYDTRPWTVYGEGPTKVVEGHLSEKNNKDFTAEDVRFTTKDGILYLTVLDAPKDGSVKIRSLSDGNKLYPKKIESVTLLDSNESIKWERTDEAMVIHFPKSLPNEYAFVFKIQ